MRHPSLFQPPHHSPLNRLGKPTIWLSILLISIMMAGCGGVPKLEKDSRSTAAGLALFDATTVAHGREAFTNINDRMIA